MKTQNLNIDIGGVSYIGYEFSKLPLVAALLVAQRQIDEAADIARVAAIGTSLRALEYECASAEAKAFAGAGYVGDMPPSVQAWADAAELGPQAAADSIIAEAEAWKVALYAIRAARLKGKQQVLKATSHGAAEVLADVAITAIQASVSGVGNAA